MDEQLTKLLKMLKLWLKKNELDGDTSFYSIEKWQSRGEEFLNDSEYVITTEGGLHFLLNFGDSDEFYELINSFGYYIELGHSWNFGFYKIPDGLKIDPKLPYAKKLQDMRWRKKREFILERSEHKCEDCGNTVRLEIHHCYYMYGFEPWEFPLDSLRCLCRNCHEERGSAEQILRGHLAQLQTDDLKTLSGFITSGWYEQKQMFDFIRSINYDQEAIRAKFEQLLKSRK